MGFVYKQSCDGVTKDNPNFFLWNGPVDALPRHVHSVSVFVYTLQKLSLKSHSVIIALTFANVHRE